MPHNKLTRSLTNGKLTVPRYNNMYGKPQLKRKIPTLINNLPSMLKIIINNENIKYVLRKYTLKG